MTIHLEIQHASDSAAPSDDKLGQWTRSALAGRRDSAEMTIRIVDEAESAELNQTYRHKQGPTNVLSFPFEVPEGVPVTLLGDLVICAAVVEREAQQQHKSLEAHWAHMVVHGSLHLLGYDHIDAKDAEAMEALEISILNSMGFANPYEEEADIQ